MRQDFDDGDSCYCRGVSTVSVLAFVSGRGDHIIIHNTRIELMVPKRIGLLCMCKISSRHVKKKKERSTRRLPAGFLVSKK